MAQLDLTGKGAAYIRVSEEEQNESRQGNDIDKWCQRHGVTISASRFYTDKGWTRDEADQRPEFQTMLTAAQDGLINWIVVSESDRFGTKSTKQLFHFLYLLEECGCRLYTTTDEDLTADDFAGSINTLLRGEKSVSEGITRAMRVASNVRDRAKAGQWNGGYIPFGLDAVCFEIGKMTELWRVSILGRDLRVKISADRKTRTSYDGENNFPRVENGQVLQLRPTLDTRALDYVRRVFERFDSEAINFSQLAKWLNSEGVKPYYNEQWQASQIMHILHNPVYIGRPATNKTVSGKYTGWKDGQVISRKPGMKLQRNGREQWIMPPQPIFTPIIDNDLWSSVQKKYDKISKIGKGLRAPHSPDQWLSGILYCGMCGKRMQGKKDSKTGRATYICSTWTGWRKDRKECPCCSNTLAQGRVEEALRQYLADTGTQLQEIAGAGKKGQPPKALAEAVWRAYEAWGKMVDRVGGNPTFDLRCLAGQPVGSEVQTAYRQLFKGQRNQLQAKLDQLETEHTKLTAAWAELPTQRSKGKAKLRLEELETEIEGIESQLKNHADDYAEAVAEARRLGAQWEEAQAALQSEGNARRKADAVRRVVSKIVAHFEPTGKRNPTSRLVSWEFVPAVSSEKAEKSTTQDRIHCQRQACLSI